jgi:hypothetical protein
MFKVLDVLLGGFGSWSRNRSKVQQKKKKKKKKKKGKYMEKRFRF